MLLNIGGHGLGDCLLSLQISQLLTVQGIEHKNLISTRQEIYDVLKYVFGNKFELYKIDESVSEDNAIENNFQILSDLKYEHNADNVCYNVPDLLFTNPLSLELSKYNLSPQVIKKTRVLSDVYFEKDKIVYCGLATNTNGYLYRDIGNLLSSLCDKLPDYTIYFPYVTHWVRDIKYDDNILKINKPNLWIDENPNFNNSMDILKKSVYGVFTCNGPSHVAYHMNIPRLILDPQFHRVVWMSRWKEDYEECIDISTDYNSVSELIYSNVTVPQTTMIDRKIILNMIQSQNKNWHSLFYFKY